MLIKALDIRERYMINSKQTFPSIPSRFLRSVDKRPSSEHEVIHDDRKAIEGR